MAPWSVRTSLAKALLNMLKVEVPNSRALAQFGRPKRVSERIGKKPHEADLSYTAVCTGLSTSFQNGSQDREESETSEGRHTILLTAEGAIGERVCCGKNVNEQISLPDNRMMKRC
jgi:hypothetical protein